MAIATTSNVDELFATAVQHENFWLKCAALANPKAPLLKLTDQFLGGVTAHLPAVLMNPSLPESILRSIVSDLQNDAPQNPIFRDLILDHKNLDAATKTSARELPVQERQCSHSHIKQDAKYFCSTLSDSGIQLGVLLGLLAISSLNAFPALPDPCDNDDFWLDFIEELGESMLSLANHLAMWVASPDLVKEFRISAASKIKDRQLMEIFLSDDCLLPFNGPGGYDYKWNVSRSPRSGVAENPNCSTKLLNIILDEEEFSGHINSGERGIVWRIVYNPASDTQILERVLDLILSGQINDEDLSVSQIMFGTDEDISLIERDDLPNSLLAKVATIAETFGY